MGDISTISKRLEEKVNRLIAVWDATKDENEKLKFERAELKREIEGYKADIAGLNEKAKLIKLAKSVSGSETGSSAEVKLKINEYIREIDKCIGMLKE